VKVNDLSKKLTTSARCVVCICSGKTPRFIPNVDHAFENEQFEQNKSACFLKSVVYFWNKSAFFESVVYFWNKSPA
jgi:hypothetical protein